MLRFKDRYAAAFLAMGMLTAYMAADSESLYAQRVNISQAATANTPPHTGPAQEAVASHTLPAVSSPAKAHRQDADTNHSKENAKQEYIKKVLFIGDSMTGWMSERLNAFGQKNGFTVATVVWDGSTIKKWADSSRFESIVKEQAPDAIFISLGLNELFLPNPQTLAGSLAEIERVVGDIPMLWIGPPSWPGQEGRGAALNNWLASHLGAGRYFNSSALRLPRQSKNNPHPTKAGICTWIDDVCAWIPGHTKLDFRSLTPPAHNAMTRGKVFIYRKMKEAL